MAVEHSDIIDMVSVEDSTGTLCLSMIEPRAWEPASLDGRIAEIEAKVNQYLHYLASGQAWKDHPTAKAAKKRIELFCRNQPPVEMDSTFRAIEEQLAAQHIGFRVLVGGDPKMKPAEYRFSTH